MMDTELSREITISKMVNDKEVIECKGAIVILKDSSVCYKPDPKFTAKNVLSELYDRNKLCAKIDSKELFNDLTEDVKKQFEFRGFIVSMGEIQNN